MSAVSAVTAWVILGFVTIAILGATFFVILVAAIYALSR